jgi:hypothetical protein
VSIAELLKWQWEGYPTYHRSRVNLLIHILVVPLFLAANVELILGFATGSWVVGLGGLVIMAVSFGLQGFGHRKEQEPPVPYTGIKNALSRIFLEQWVTFPRFVISGGWIRAIRQAGF